MADRDGGLNFVLKTKRVLAQINVLRKTSYSWLKPSQFKCIKSALERDTLGVLPTGYGKSLIFEALPYFSDSVVIVISPLNSIIEEQVNRYGQTAIHFSETILRQLNGEKSNNVQRLQQCDFTYVIGHPEQFVTKAAFRLFTDDKWQSRVSHIIIDEAHCVTEWGAGFREKFLELSKLKAVFPNANVLALTATATVTLQKKIADALQLQNPTVISTNIDRMNIKLEVKRRPAVSGGEKTAQGSYDFIFTPIVSDLRDQMDRFPKTIIYSKLKWCGYGYEEITRPVFDEEQASSSLQPLVSQYHSPCTPQVCFLLLLYVLDYLYKRAVSYKISLWGF